MVKSRVDEAVEDRSLGAVTPVGAVSPHTVEESEMDNKVKGAILAVVIVACLGFVGYRMFGGGGQGGAGSESEADRDLYCTQCRKHYTAAVSESLYAQLMMAGMNAGTKATCPDCSQAAAVAAVNCGACGEWVPSPGSGSGSGSSRGPRSRGPVCPACKKPLVLPTPGSQAPAAE